MVEYFIITQVNFALHITPCVFVFKQILVPERVVANLVSTFDDFAGGILVVRNILADKEKGGRDAVLVQNIKDLAGILGVRPVVKGEGDHIIVVDAIVVYADRQRLRIWHQKSTQKFPDDGPTKPLF
jgi:hypothetical protein